MDNFLAYQAYNYFFDNPTDVDNYVLINFNASDRDRIYTNEKFGLDSVRKLIVWV